jgi:hypothetical protein
MANRPESRLSRLPSHKSTSVRCRQQFPPQPSPLFHELSYGTPPRIARGPLREFTPGRRSRHLRIGARLFVVVTGRRRALCTIPLSPSSCQAAEVAEGNTINHRIENISQDLRRTRAHGNPVDGPIRTSEFGFLVSTDVRVSVSLHEGTPVQSCSFHRGVRGPAVRRGVTPHPLLPLSPFFVNVFLGQTEIRARPPWQVRRAAARGGPGSSPDACSQRRATADHRCRNGGQVKCVDGSGLH